MEMCPFLSRPLWTKKENEEILEIKEAPCQRDKCFMYKNGRCGLLYSPDYSEIKNSISEMNMSFNENIKAIYELLKEETQKIIAENEKYAKLIETKLDDLINLSKETFNRFLEDVKQNNERLLSSFENSLNQIVEREKEEMEKFRSLMGETAGRLTEQSKEELNSIKTAFENLFKEIEREFSDIFEKFKADREELLKSFEKEKEARESFIVSFENSLREISAQNRDEIQRIKDLTEEMARKLMEQSREELNSLRGSFESIFQETEKRFSDIFERFKADRDELLRIFEKEKEARENFIISFQNSLREISAQNRDEMQKFGNLAEKMAKKLIEQSKEELNSLKGSFGSLFQEIEKRFYDVFEKFKTDRERFLKSFEQERSILSGLFENLRRFSESMNKVLKEERIKRKFEEARIFYLRGEYKESEKILRDILKEREEDRALLLLGLSLLGDKRFSEAQVYLERYLQKHPEVPEALSGLAHILYEKGEKERAIELLEKAREKAPDSEDILYLYGLILVKSGETEKARKIFDEILKINPYFEPAKEAIRKYFAPLEE